MRKLAGISCSLIWLCTVLTGAASAGQTVRVDRFPNEVRLLNKDDAGLIFRVGVGTVDLTSVLTREGTFNLLSASGLTRSHRVGEPNLPTANRLISIPYGCELKAEIIDSEVEEISLTDLGLTDALMPAQPSMPKSVDPASIPFEYHRATYRRAGYYSQPRVRTEVLGVMRGLRLGIVTVAPFEYSPTDNVLRVHKDLKIRVTFEHPDLAATEAKRLESFSPYFEPIYDRVFNYQDESLQARDYLTSYPVKYLIIADRMFETQLQPFIEWKTRKGFIVVTGFTDEICSGAVDNTEIKNYIQNQYESGTPEDPAPSFVLFVGDAQQIPPFAGATGMHVTDLPFCEFTGDEFPEIYYGRFSAQDSTELQPQIDKTLEYEQYLMPDPGYLEEVTLISGYDAYNAATYGNGQVNYGSTHYFNVAHGISPNIWLHPESGYTGASAAIRQTVSDGIGFYNYTAHCTHYGHDAPAFTTGHIPDLTNHHKYLLGIGNCCQANTFGADHETPCFGEAFLQAPDKGGIGYIGSTNLTYWDEDYHWAVGNGPIVPTGATYEETGPGAYDGVFHDHGEPVSQHFVTNGAVVFAGNLGVTEAGSRVHYYWETYHLMGDPSLMTYMGVPSANNVIHDDTVFLSAGSFTVQADPGSYVGVSADSEMQGAGYVDSSGEVEIPLTGFDSAGISDIVVTCQNRIPHISTLQIDLPMEPYVIYDYHTIDDVAGNNNGLVESGEGPISLGTQLVNIGQLDATDVSATISTSDSYVTFTDSTEPFGTIPPNLGSVYVDDAFAIEIAPGTPDRHEIAFDLELTDSSRSTWYGGFQIQVHAPVIGYLSLAVDDITGNNNGVLDPGETAELVVTLENSGSGQAFMVEAYLSETDDFVTVPDDYGTFGLIDSAGGTADNYTDVFVVTADSTCPFDHSVPVELLVGAENGYSVSLNFSLDVGVRGVFYSDDFSVDQGWLGLGGSAEWTMGPVSGGGGDPLEDHTDSSSDNAILGNDLTVSGKYNDDIPDVQWAVSPVLDCGHMSDIVMTYYHWLGIQSSSSDHAYLDVFNGVSWVTLYENGPVNFQEDSWIEEEYDLSAYADSNPCFQIRFGLGPTNSSVTFSGWNVDDILLKGLGDVYDPDLQMAQIELIDSVLQGFQTEQFIRIKNLGEGTLAIRFSSDDAWLEFSGDRQIILAGDSLDLIVAMNAATLPPGDHTGSLEFTSNDASKQSGDIPVFLNVYLSCCEGGTGNVDCSQEDRPDIADMQALIDHLFINLQPLCCVAEADVDISGGYDPAPNDVDIADMQRLIDNQFISMEALPLCP